MVDEVPANLSQSSNENVAETEDELFFALSSCLFCDCHNSASDFQLADHMINTHIKPWEVQVESTYPTYEWKTWLMLNSSKIDSLIEFLIDAGKSFRFSLYQCQILALQVQLVRWQAFFAKRSLSLLSKIASLE